MRVLIGNPAFYDPINGEVEKYMLGSGMRFPWSILKKRNERPRYAMFPFFLAYTAAVLEQDGVEVDVIDGVPLNIRAQEFEDRVIEKRPDLVLLEPNTAVIDRVIAMARRLKQRLPSKICLAGPHASACARELLSENPVIDFVIVGEYEHAVRDLVRALGSDTPLASLDGVYSRDRAGRITGTGRTRAIANLDNLPPPARHNFPAYFDTDMSGYNDGFCQKRPAFHMHTSRGCPFRCNFCLWVQVLYDRGRQRHFSPQRVVDEVMMLKRDFGAQEIYFDDDNFTANPKHVIALCDELVAHGRPVSWSAMADAIVLDESLLHKMADAGCIGIKFGLDSADPEVLEATQKPLRIRRLERIVALARQLGVKTHMTVVFGLTGETRESMNKTFDFACRLDIDSIQFSIATPCPGTEFYEELKREDRLRMSSWADLDGANASVVRYDGFSQSYIEQFQATAHSRWLRAKLKSPRWIGRQARLLVRLVRSQGLSGLIRRVQRAVRLIRGDARSFEYESLRSLRW